MCVYVCVLALCVGTDNGCDVLFDVYSVRYCIYMGTVCVVCVLVLSCICYVVSRVVRTRCVALFIYIYVYLLCVCVCVLG